MGWWDTGIMGGDSPYDIADGLEHALGLHAYLERNDTGLYAPDSWDDETRSHIRQEMDKADLEVLADKLAGEWKCEEDIIFQVFGLLIIACGATLTDSMRARVINACSHDAWAAEDDDRKAKVDLFKADVVAYGGTPVVRRQPGLLEKLVGDR